MCDYVYIFSANPGKGEGSRRHTKPMAMTFQPQGHRGRRDARRHSPECIVLESPSPSHSVFTWHIWQHSGYYHNNKHWGRLLLTCHSHCQVLLKLKCNVKISNGKMYQLTRREEFSDIIFFITVWTNLFVFLSLFQPSLHFPPSQDNKT